MNTDKFIYGGSPAVEVKVFWVLILNALIVGGKIAPVAKTLFIFKSNKALLASELHNPLIE
jgi:hypothetical protein